MGMITIENNRFIYTGQGMREVLLDCSDYFSNKSRVPMHSPDGAKTIPGLILELMKEHCQYLGGSDGESLTYLLADVLLISHLIGSPLPVRVAEIGADSGIMSYHLAKIMGKMNANSRLCSVCNTVGNESGNQWVDRIVWVEEPPSLSMLVSDYDDTGLQGENFDVVVINGAVWFQEPYDVIREADRLVKKTGIILCHIENQPLLESCFKLFFTERKEYGITPSSSVMVVRQCH